MHTHRAAATESNLSDLLGTYLQVSARNAPPSYSLRSVATAFDRSSAHAPTGRIETIAFDRPTGGEAATESADIDGSTNIGGNAST